MLGQGCPGALELDDTDGTPRNAPHDDVNATPSDMLLKSKILTYTIEVELREEALLRKEGDDFTFI